MALFRGLSVAFLLVAMMASSSSSLFGNMEPRFWEHELKKTYCQLIQRQRIYKQEQLDIYCAGKVAFFDDQVCLIVCF